MCEKQAAAERLQAFIRTHAPGGCRILSKGDSCLCPLCDVARLMDKSELVRLRENNQELKEQLKQLEAS